MLLLTIFSVKLGAKILALNALREPSSMIRESALQSVPNVTHSTSLQETALHALPDMILLKEAASSPLLILLPPLTSAVDLGTGTTKNAYNAPTDGHSTRTISVSLCLTNAPPMITQEAA